MLLRLAGSFRFHISLLLELLCNFLFGCVCVCVCVAPATKSKCLNRKYHLLDLLQGVVVDMVQLFFVNMCVENGIQQIV